MSPLLGEAAITNIAERLNATPAQVIFSWAMGYDISVVPKPESIERQKKNIEVSTILNRIQALQALTIRTQAGQTQLPGYLGHQ
jgi:diketogulonate reductase-like aldo/keto reductase